MLLGRNIWSFNSFLWFQQTIKSKSIFNLPYKVHFSHQRVITNVERESKFSLKRVILSSLSAQREKNPTKANNVESPRGISHICEKDQGHKNSTHYGRCSKALQRLWLVRPYGLPQLHPNFSKCAIYMTDFFLIIK